jgi:hypothetical protein
MTPRPELEHKAYQAMMFTRAQMMQLVFHDQHRFVPRLGSATPSEPEQMVPTSTRTSNAGRPPSLESRTRMPP